LRTSEVLSDSRFEQVAIVAGSGMSYYDAACRAGAEVMITGDVRYHDFHAANDRIPIIDPGHAESEAYVLSATESILRNGVSLHQVPIVRFLSPTSPLQYYRYGTSD
jgi:putative NIF3 family GTP cyclohydrolase 1 type 2